MQKAPAKVIKRATSKFNTIYCNMCRKPYDINAVAKKE